MNKNVQDFLAESEEILDSLTDDLAVLADHADAGECDPDILNSIFRGAHSLKGLAGMFGFVAIQRFSHSLENLLDSLRLGKIPLSTDLVVLLEDSVERLRQMVGMIVSDPEGAVDVSDLEERIASLSIRTDAPPASNPLASLDLLPEMLASLTEYEEHRLLENLRRGRRIYTIKASFDLETFDNDLTTLTERLKRTGEVISTLPSVADGDDAGISFTILFGTDLDEAAVAAETAESRALATLVSQKGRKETEGGTTHDSSTVVPPQHVSVPPSPPSPPSSVPSSPPPVSPPQEGDHLSAKSMSRTVRVDITKLDELMNIVGELVLCHSSINEYTSRLREESSSATVNELSKLTRHLERKLTELQKGVMEIRMIPVGQLYEKLSRIVRKVSREQGKKIDLRLFGADTELDKLIIEDISDPLMHIIRNAIDHGIEPPAERLAAGKDEKGTITLTSYQKGNHVVIEVIDDGRGMDPAKILKKAQDRGIVHEGEQLSEREILDLIFLPGFSTAESVTDVSGRGVGMDVVRNNIAAVSGMVEIETEKGKGTKIGITLPITLAIIKSLIIEASGRTFAIPITSVLESLLIDADAVKTVEHKRVIQLRESTLPLLSLSEYFEFGDGALPSVEFYVVVVGVAEKRLGLVVNDLIGQRDIVIKPLGETFRGFRGISGAADLGDQRTILVLDVGGIINDINRSMQQKE